MLDPKLLRNDLDTVANALARRGYVLDKAKLAALEAQRKSLQVEAEALQNER
ncbi:MAG: serine--tRNA ligase, partial [Gammaproteobacteria bacterium]|nr:serine--tRNA ligase [Gammaproteobacteria bacterium]